MGESGDLSAVVTAYFFKPAVQLITTLMGALPACSICVGMRKRPSLLTSKPFPARRASKSGFGTPASNFGPVLTATAIIFPSATM